MGKLSKKNEEETCCAANQEDNACCHVEGVVSIDLKGQISALPKKLREDMGLLEGGKLVVVSMKDKGKVTSISLFKADKLDNMVKIMLKPVMEQIIQD